AAGSWTWSAGPGRPARRPRRSAWSRSPRPITSQRPPGPATGPIWGFRRARRAGHERPADLLVGRTAVPGARRLRRRDRLAVAVRAVRLDQPFDPAPGAAAAEVGLPDLPLRHLRRDRGARPRHPDPRILDARDRDPGERLPLVLGRRRDPGRGPD